MEDKNFKLREAMKKAARILETRILLQVPVETGALKRSIKVVPLDDGVQIMYAEYGDYTNYGTGKYYPGKFRYGTNPDPGSFKSYKKGKEGIRPQYWSAPSISDFDTIEYLVGSEIARQVEIERINKMFDEIDTEI